MNKDNDLIQTLLKNLTESIAKELDQRDQRIALLEETLKNTENELKQERLLNSPNAKMFPDKYANHLPHQVRGWTPEDS